MIFLEAVVPGLGSLVVAHQGHADGTAMLGLSAWTNAAVDVRIAMEHAPLLVRLQVKGQTDLELVRCQWASADVPFTEGFEQHPLIDTNT